MARKEDAVNWIEEIQIRRTEMDDPDMSRLEHPEKRYRDVEDRAERARYIEEDLRRLATYGDKWAYLGIWAEAKVYIQGISQTLRSGGLWEVESDSNLEYLREVEMEEYGTLKGILEQVFGSDARIPGWDEVKHRTRRPMKNKQDWSTRD